MDELASFEGVTGRVDWKEDVGVVIRAACEGDSGLLNGEARLELRDMLDLNGEVDDGGCGWDCDCNVYNVCSGNGFWGDPPAKQSCHFVLVWVRLLLKLVQPDFNRQVSK